MTSLRITNISPDFYIKPENDFRHEAMRLADLCRVQNTNNFKLPVDLSVADGLRKIKKIIKVQMEESGRLRPVADGFYVFLSESDNYGRKNFTHAHEIGHTFFFDISQSKIRPLELSGLKEPDVERFCDLFAKNLLMPANIFETFRGEIINDVSINKFERLAKIFAASLESIIYRAASINWKLKKDQFILLFAKSPNLYTGLENKLRVKTGILDGKVFVPFNTSASSLGLLADKYYEKLYHYETVTAKEYILANVLQNKIPKYREYVLECDVEYKCYGHNQCRYLIGLFNIHNMIDPNLSNNEIKARKKTRLLSSQ